MHSPWWALILVLVLSCIFLSLSLWQLKRYFWQSEQLTFLQQQHTLPPIHFNAHPDVTLADYGRKITGELHSQAPYTILLDNQIYQGGVGYRVLSAFELEPNTPWVWVDRGWIPMGNSRAILPRLAALPEKTTLTGLVDKALYNHLVSKASDVEEVTWPLRIQTMDIPWLSTQVEHDFHPWVIVLQASDPLSFTQSSHAPWLTPMRHQVYALQWLSFMIIAFSFWFRFTIRKRPSI